VEAALLEHPAVREVAVVGAPDPARGQVVKAVIVLRDGIDGDAMLVRALQDHVKNVIAPYKYPRVVEFVAGLPKTPSGKIQRYALRQGDGSVGSPIAPT
jgi:2-aminobenzoate-CoA ligase